MNKFLSFLKYLNPFSKKTFKSKQEIIKELFDDYYCKFPNKRAIDTETAQCVYLDVTTLNRCAVGMCMLPSDEGFPVQFLSHTGGVRNLEYRLSYADMSLDDILKEEYRGHDAKFWSDLQVLHDLSSFWVKGTVMSEGGRKELRKIKDRYSGK